MRTKPPFTRKAGLSYNIPCGAAGWPLCRCRGHLRRLSGVGAPGSCRIFVFQAKYSTVRTPLQAFSSKIAEIPPRSCPWSGRQGEGTLPCAFARSAGERADVGIDPYGCFASEAGRAVRRNALSTLDDRCKKRERRGRSLFSLLFSPGQQSLAPAGMESSSSSRCSFSSPFSLCTAEMSMPQEGMPIIFRVGRFKMATAVLPTSSSGS